MKSHAQHLELVSLASTVTPAWGAGWDYTTTPAPRPRPAERYVQSGRTRLAVVSAS